jgi:chromosome segregation ATPase
MAFELNSGRYKYREDRLGDDLYYLGLLFTLVSLAWSLHAYGQFEGVDLIISNFGIALFTTIAGLALRVALYKWRGEELEEPELKARFELAEAVNQLKIQLTSCIEDMNSFRVGLAQSMAELVKDGTGKVAAAIEEGIVVVRDRATLVKEAAEQTLADLPLHLDKLNEATGLLSTALEELWQRIQRIEIPPDLLQKELSPALKILARHGRAVEKLTAAQEARSEQITGAVATMEALAQRANEHLQGVTQSISDVDKFATRLSDAGQQVVALVDTISATKNQLLSQADQASQTLNRMREDSEANLNVIKSNREEMDKELEKSRHAVDKVQSALIAMTTTIIDRLGDRGD